MQLTGAHSPQRRSRRVSGSAIRDRASRYAARPAAHARKRANCTENACDCIWLRSVARYANRPEIERQKKQWELD
eukprot:398090-Rhodomonas_salina.1